MKESAELRATRIIFVGSFLLSTTVLIALSLSRPLKSNIAASYVLGAILVLGTMSLGAFRGKRRGFLRLFLLASVLNVLIVPPEAILRLRGFRYESGIEFGYPRPYQFSVFEPHEKLFWRFPPSAPDVNSYGFVGPEVIRPKPAGTLRILFIGNSCTYQGFPHMIELALREIDPAVECLNFSTPGYTSHQGKVIVQSYIGELEPDLVVASFGWNDRWLAYGAVDGEKRISVSRDRPAEGLRTLYSKWRLLQYLRKAMNPVLGSSEPLDKPRVPVESFRANLREIGSECRRRGIPVIFATEPSSHPALGVPDYVVESRYALSKESSLALFREYNKTVREVAGEGDDWLLLDLDARISGRSDIREIFTADGFHFRRGGLALVAMIASRFIKEHFLEGGEDASHESR